MNRFIPGLVILVLAANASAAMYKWVDENGEVHYTQSPPPEGVQGETIKPPPKVDTKSAVEQLDAKEKQWDDLQKQKADAAKKEAEQQDQIAKKKANCKLGHDKLDSYVQPRVKKTNADGSKEWMTEEERQAQIKEANNIIKEFCD